MRGQLFTVGALTALSQLAAFLKLWFTAHLYGIGPELDGYNLALIVPTMISGIVAGCLQTGMFPVRARLQSEQTQSEVDSFDRTIFWLLAALGMIIAAGLYIAGSTLTNVIFQSAAASSQQALQAAFPALTSLVALNAAGDCAGYILAMRHRYAIAAAAPVVNGLVGAAFLAVSPFDGVASLVAGTIGGVLVQVMICVKGLNISGLRLNGRMLEPLKIKPMLGEMISLGLWILPGVFISNLAVSLPPVWIAVFGEGANSAFGYAYRFHSSLVQLFVMATSPIILANFAELVAVGDRKGVRQIIVKAIVFSLTVGLIGTALVGIVGVSALELLLGGRFDTAAAQRVADHWWWLTLGLCPAILGNVFAKLWQSQKRPVLISFMASSSLFTMVTAFYSVSPLLHEMSVAAAVSASSLAVVLFGFPYLGVGPLITKKRQ